jgi:hypothetical protein
MQLVKPLGGRRKAFVRHELLEQVRDIGGRLEYVMARYDRLVRDIGGESVPSPDFTSRALVINRQLEDVTKKLQELFVLEYEAQQAEAYAEFEKTSERRRASREAPAPRRRRDRDPVGPLVAIPGGAGAPPVVVRQPWAVAR